MVDSFNSSFPFLPRLPVHSGACAQKTGMEEEITIGSGGGGWYTSLALEKSAKKRGVKRMRSTKLIRAAKIAYIVTSLLFCVGGALLLTLGDLSVSVIGTAGGILLLVFGLVKLAGYFSKDLYRLAFQFDLALGLLFLALGVVFLCRPQALMAELCILLGLASLVDGLFKIQIAVDAKRFGLRTWLLIALEAAVTVVLGLLLLFRPVQSARVLMILLGVNLLAEGILNLSTALTVVKIVRNQRAEA